ISGLEEETQVPRTERDKRRCGIQESGARSTAAREEDTCRTERRDQKEAEILGRRRGPCKEAGEGEEAFRATCLPAMEREESGRDEEDEARLDIRRRPKVRDDRVSKKCGRREPTGCGRTLDAPPGDEKECRQQRRDHREALRGKVAAGRKDDREEELDELRKDRKPQVAQERRAPGLCERLREWEVGHGRVEGRGGIQRQNEE